MRVQRYLIEGRVQGVGFRYFARRSARRLGLAGYVRNLPDGSVEAVARGTDEALAAFEQALRQGPPGSHVDSVRLESGEALPSSEGFEIT
ncbi:MAG TPA: acylphosphatase [Candidatus Polarisedimenticolia bacterium]|nr:acylphosphatase [Candidatus Polarisedimenticolia bacterium]